MNLQGARIDRQGTAGRLQTGAGFLRFLLQQIDRVAATFGAGAGDFREVFAGDGIGEGFGDLGHGVGDGNVEQAGVAADRDIQPTGDHPAEGWGGRWRLARRVGLGRGGQAQFVAQPVGHPIDGWRHQAGQVANILAGGNAFQQIHAPDPFGDGVHGFHAAQVDFIDLVAGHHRRGLLLDQQRGGGGVLFRGLGQIVGGGRESRGSAPGRSNASGPAVRTRAVSFSPGRPGATGCHPAGHCLPNHPSLGLGGVNGVTGAWVGGRNPGG